ncbi:hypothetical protein B9Z55_007727 [Caenorhabditis nigoni]|uniref:MATH domain-containing protein n=1 Tax=Caenorhabditis nigoni TaxID=1611254 RepID=A0A2G5VB34_9PELO|nr:hypothetical protein B9Z55_007727 [Caenorhabditis nigoni]
MASNEEGNIGKELSSTKLLEILQALENRNIALTEEINKNKQNYDELSERLQSIEASISKLSNSKEDSQKSKDVSEKTSVVESIVPADNTTNVTSESEKRFKLKHVFTNVRKFIEAQHNNSEREDHYNVKWFICVKRLKNHLAFYVFCEPIVPADKWSIQTRVEMKILRKYRNDVIKTIYHCYENNKGWGFHEFLEWEKMEKEYLVKGNLTVEADVSIIETTGLGKEKIREFDESQKHVSDVILVVRDTKFYALKMFLLGYRHQYLAKFYDFTSVGQASHKSWPQDAPPCALVMIPTSLGQILIIDFYLRKTTVEGVALLADMYDAPTAMRRCEEFLMEKSKQSLKKKLKIANRYGLEKLEEKCMSEIAALEGKRYVAPKDTKVTKKQPKKKWFTFR